MIAVSRWRDLLGKAILLLIGVLLVEVLLEGWLVTVLRDGQTEAQWPKTLKSALYIVLFALTITKITVDRRWRDMLSKADIALAVLGLIMIVAGVLGGSPAQLIGEALFVYFRGVIVFYALRALKPSWDQVKPLLWITGILVVINGLLAIWQLIAGTPAYTALGWVDLKWAGEGRAQGLLEHPNDLGHVTGLMVLGLAAWFAMADKISKRWWVLFVFVAFILGIAQSRQSTLAALAGLMVIAVLHRARLKRVMAAGLVVAALSALPLVISPDSRAELAFRMRGLLNAIGVEVAERDRSCALEEDCEESDGEIRVLFIKQGVALWQERPLLGYGVGQFGGIAAVKHDPEWNMDPRFVEVLGPDGFYMYKFEATSVDVFWLHLLVEAGALGLIAYLVWMGLIAAPLALAAWRRSISGRDNAVVLWAAATLVFAIAIAAWSISLEDPLWPPLMFAVVGFAWVLRRKA